MSTLPPHDLNAERAVLRGLLTDWPTACSQIQEVGLSADDFYKKLYGELFKAAMALSDRGIAPDPSVLLGQVQDPARTDRATTFRARMEEILAIPATTANMAFFAKSIRDKARARRAIALLQERAEDLRESNGNFDEELAGVIEDLHIIEEDHLDGVQTSWFRTVDELRAATDGAVPWLVRGLLAVGEITLLAAAPKCGKSTMVVGLLAALERGQKFAGLPTKKASVVVLTEEPAPLVLEKAHNFNLGSALFLTREIFRGHVALDLYVRRAVQEAARHGAKLIVIDTFARFAGLGPDQENDAASIEKAMRPLLSTAAGGLAVLVVAHHRKNPGKFGEQVRGSSALVGAVDTVAELRRLPEDGPRSQRILEIQGRHQETPDEPITIELIGGKYLPIGSPEEGRLERARQKIIEVLSKGMGMRRQEILKAVPGKLGPTTKALKSLVREGVVERSGKGRSGDPYVYMLRPGASGCVSQGTQPRNLRLRGGVVDPPSGGVATVAPDREGNDRNLFPPKKGDAGKRPGEAGE